MFTITFTSHDQRKLAVQVDTSSIWTATSEVFENVKRIVGRVVRIEIEEAPASETGQKETE